MTQTIGQALTLTAMTKWGSLSAKPLPLPVLPPREPQRESEEEEEEEGEEETREPEMGNRRLEVLFEAGGEKKRDESEIKRQKAS